MFFEDEEEEQKKKIKYEINVEKKSGRLTTPPLPSSSKVPISLPGTRPTFSKTTTGEGRPFFFTSRDTSKMFFLFQSSNDVCVCVDPFE